MKRGSNAPAPTDEQILSYDNVPVAVAARYIGWSSVTVTNALKQELAPFGFASKNPEKGTYAYNISPGLLVKYKKGDLPTYRLKEVMEIAAYGVEQLINAKLGGFQKVLDILVRS